MNEALYTRDGHPSMLSLDRYDTGELGDAARHGLESHVEGCADCRARLNAVAHPSLVLRPRSDHDRSTGSATIAYLVASTAVAMAAAAVLWLGAPAWPSSHTARQGVSEPVHVSSAYTSVAQDDDDAGAMLELELASVRTAAGESVTASPRGEGWLAIVAIDGELGASDTDGGVEPEVAVVLAAARAVTEPITVGVPRKGSRRTVAIFCPEPFSVEVGDVLAPDSECIARELGGSARGE